MRITYSKEPIKSKPADGINTFRWGCNNRIVDKSVEEIAKDIGAGQTIHIGAYSAINRASVSKAKFLFTDFFALDFDNDAYKRSTTKDESLKYTYDEIYLRALNYGLEPTFTYHSFNSTDDFHKFRFFYKLEEPITLENKRKFDILFDFFLEVFPELDTQCSDTSRLFFGTNKGIAAMSGLSLNETNLLMKWQEIFSARVHENLAREMRKKAKLYGVNLNSKNKPNFVLSETNNTIKPEFIDDEIGACYFEEKSSKKGKDGKVIERTTEDKIIPTRIKNWEATAYKRSSFFRGFIDGTLVLIRPERLTLISNLAFIEGGLVVYKNTLQSHINKYEHSFQYYINELNSFLDWNPKPISYKKYSVEDELSDSFPNLLVALKRTEMAEKYLNEEKDEMNLIIDDLFGDAREFAESQYKIVKGIKAECAIGKTEMYINMDFSQYKKVLIALPTHALAEEVEARFNAVGKQVTRVRRRPSISNPEYWKFLKAGLGQKANQIWESHFAIIQNQNQEYIEYINSIKEAASDDTKIVLATHEYSLLKGVSEYDFIIYDEDICLSAIKQETTSIKDLETFAKGLIDKTNLTVLITNLKLESEKLTGCHAKYFSQVFDGFNIKVNMNGYHGAEIPESNVFNFLTCSGYAINSEGTIRYSYKRKLDFEGKKVLVLSATLSEEIFDVVFKDYASSGNKIRKYNTVKNKGVVKQDMVYTYSKTCLKEQFDEVVNYIKWRCPDWEERTLITFKELIPRFKKADFKTLALTDEKDMAFGSTEGIDALKGEKILVVGKFNYDDTFYKLAAKALGFDIDYSKNPLYPRKNNRYNNFEFPIMTYENDKLRALHFYYMEHELVQAVGRARAIREESADVMLFCDLPLLQPDEFFYDINDRDKARQADNHITSEDK